MKLLKWFDEHGSKINWGASFLDGDAIAGLNEALLEARKEQEADMFWYANEPICSRESIDAILHDELEYDSSDVGKRIEIARARSLPNITVLITAYDEDEVEFNWEEVRNE